MTPRVWETMGGNIAPEAGCLAVKPNGDWYVLAQWQYYGDSTPLAPAPHPGGLWDALRGLPGAQLAHYEDCDCDDPDEPGGCMIYFHTGLGKDQEEWRGQWYLLVNQRLEVVLQAETGDEFLDLHVNDPALDVWLQRGRVLAAYIAQPGWHNEEAPQ